LKCLRGTGGSWEFDEHRSHRSSRCVIGAGFSGIGISTGLDRAGLSDYLIVEEGHGFGGTWYWNRYPGVAVDIPSFSYQFSFAQRTSWSRVYASGAELLDYAEQCATRYGLRDKVRFGTRITRATFDEGRHVWRLETNRGDSLNARHVVDATGVLTVPKSPDIDGIETFAGTTIHTARWDPTQDLRRKRVAVIGTGASAVQVIPAIAREAEQLTIFQRTPIYAMGCKRPSFHNEYVATYNRDDVLLETDPIAQITADGVVTQSGTVHDVDVLILATGFKVFDPGNFPKYPVTGRAGRAGRDLERYWEENRYQAYEGVSVPGFPNYFTMFGPYGYNGSSYLTSSRPRAGTSSGR
jgi:cation diffusion facilitator CzcD-associated flavoprotein CzcO